jgi:hypothetical protein
MTTMTPAPLPPPMVPQPAVRRPTGVSILAVLGFVAAGLFVLLAVASLVATATIGSMMDAVYKDQMQGASFADAGGALGVVFAITFVIVAAIPFVWGLGFWKGWSWIWWVSGILWALSILSSLLSIRNDAFQSVISILVNLFLIWYISQKGVQRWFKVDMNLPWAK